MVALYNSAVPFCVSAGHIFRDFFFRDQNGSGAGEVESSLKPHEPAVDFRNDSASDFLVL